MIAHHTMYNDCTMCWVRRLPAHERSSGAIGSAKVEKFRSGAGTRRPDARPLAGCSPVPGIPPFVNFSSITPFHDSSSVRTHTVPDQAICHAASL